MDGIVSVKQDVLRPRVNISFQNLNYSVYCQKEKKCIINNISGSFKGGHMSAILGPSGSGKTTLLNILAGYKITKVSGQIFINNLTRDHEQMSKISRYIMQENSSQPCLTVLDSMMIAADFKLDSRVTKQEKLKMVTDILRTLGLTKVKNSRTEILSGGERKRLAVALELINNPSVIFLDEPTSGLDEQASFQCLSVLKQLAKEGRTVICSIHAPSAKAFALFDHVYIMTDGQCVYQGQGDQLLPFLDKIQLTCPVHYNPIDYFIDVASGEYGQQLNNLVTLTKNGKLTYSCEGEIDICDTIIYDTKSLDLKTIPEYYTSTLTQFKVLLYRMFLQSYRNHTAIIMKSLMYSVLTTMFTALYYGCGNDATKIYINMTYLFLSVVALMYCALMPPLIHFPVEIKLIRSEYFNRWYNIPAYFLAKSVAVIPGFVIFTIFFISVTYPLTDQPISADRILKFIVIRIFVDLIADASSMCVAAVFSIVNSFFIGITIMVPPTIFAVFGFGYPFHLHPFFLKLMLRTSFLRYALDAVVDVVYDDRPEHLYCPNTEVLCPLTSSKVITHAMGLGNMNYWVCVAALLGFYVLTKCCQYFLLKQRLRPGKPAEMAFHVSEIGKKLLIKYLP